MADYVAQLPAGDWVNDLVTGSCAGYIILQVAAKLITQSKFVSYFEIFEVYFEVLQNHFTVSVIMAEVLPIPVVVSGANGRKGGDDPSYEFPLQKPFLPADSEEVLPTLIKVVVIGHSFVRRLRDHLTSERGQGHNLGLDPNMVNVVMYAQGGMTADRLRQHHFQFIRNQLPDIVYIELGCNDLTDPSLSPAQIATDLHNLAHSILQLGVSQVVVGQTLWREDAGIPDDMPDYNMRVVHLNNHLQQQLRATPGSSFWHHRGMWRSSHPIISVDGAHLTRIGNHRLYRSIRGAIIQAVQRVHSAQ